MRRRVKVKSNGWLTDVRRDIDKEGNTIWVEDLTDTTYRTSELEFLPIVVGREQPINSNEPFVPEEIVAFDPMEMHYDPQSMSARFVQNMHIRMTKEVVDAALQMATDQQLKDELKRRENDRRSMFPSDVRCRDCKHCGAGKTYPCTKTAVTVCLAKPKPKVGPDCYYATSLSCKVCEKFDPK